MERIVAFVYRYYKYNNEKLSVSWKLSYKVATEEKNNTVINIWIEETKVSRFRGILATMQPATGTCTHIHRNETTYAIK